MLFYKDIVNGTKMSVLMVNSYRLTIYRQHSYFIALNSLTPLVLLYTPCLTTCLPKTDSSTIKWVSLVFQLSNILNLFEVTFDTQLFSQDHEEKLELCNNVTCWYYQNHNMFKLPVVICSHNAKHFHGTLVLQHWLALTSD